MRPPRPQVSVGTYAAGLVCGTVLSYDIATFVPDIGEVVPCRRHGYCPVASRDERDGRRGRGPGPMRTHRSQAELLEFLRRRPVASVHALRRHGFTLRLVAAAERAGLLYVDLPSGRIALRCAAADLSG
jgi:hypothetical protein